MRDLQPTSSRERFPVGGRLFLVFGMAQRCVPIGAQMGMLYRCAVACPGSGKSRFSISNMLADQRRRRSEEAHMGYDYVDSCCLVDRL
jgi:hypothetical protein